MLVDTQKLVAPQQLHVNLVIFVREPVVSMIKNTDFYTVAKSNVPTALFTGPFFW